MGTTISEFGSGTVSLATLAALITQLQTQQINTGGGNVGDGTEAVLKVGPGLSGGGPMLGTVLLNLTAPIPWFDDAGGGGDGDPGPPGMAGIRGTNGATGGVGPAGPAIFMAGDSGEEGDLGAPGAPGVAGATGPAGPAGPTGPAGPIPPFVFFGDDGEEGGVGPPGAQGAPGTGGGGGTVALPGTIPDLTFWWEADDILGTANNAITRLRERTPWIGGIAAANSTGGAIIDAALLNSLPVLTWPAATAASAYTMPAGFTITAGCTIFIVAKGSTSAGNQAILGSAGSGAVGLYLGVGSAAIALLDTGIAIVGTSSTAWVAGTWFQANVTYVSATGAYAFRQAQAAAGSGTGSAGAGAGATSILGDDGGAAKLNAASLAAVIVYNRVLTAPQIASIEAYLHTKWNV